MSLLDLHNTLLYARTTGMVEMNPIARWLMQFDSVGLLIGWKFVTTALAVSVFLVARDQPIGELGALIGLLLLVWLTARWDTYSTYMADFAIYSSASIEHFSSSPGYVRMSP